MTDIKTICWLAGLLEGEGSFVLSRQFIGGCSIQYCTTDLDVALKASIILNVSITTRRPRPRRQTSYEVRLSRRSEVAAWLMTLYPLMGYRRKKRFRELLAVWRSAPIIRRRGLEFERNRTLAK